MKKIIFLLTINLFCIKSFSQQKDFEGVVFYDVKVKPKDKGTSEKLMKTILAAGDNMTAYIKNNNYRQITELCDTYFNPQKQKIYLKFRNIDTLYYMDYASDTNSATNIMKSQNEQNIAGITCKEITITNAASSRKYFYSPLFHLNPEPDKNNSAGNYNVYLKETESVWLGSEEEAKTYSMIQTAVKIERKEVDQSVFNLPQLPEKLFTPQSVFKEPEFLRKEGWIKYLQTNLNAPLGAKYIKIPKGETLATQTINVAFVISETGQVQEVKVMNKEEVHPKLAEEAIRVISESRGWKPATIYGEKIRFWLNQPVTFQATK